MGVIYPYDEAISRSSLPLIVRLSSLLGKNQQSMHISALKENGVTKCLGIDKNNVDRDKIN